MSAIDDDWSRVKDGINRSVTKSTRQALATSEILIEPPIADVGASPHEVVLRKDRMRLLHYIGGPKEKASIPVLLVYALINRPYILDLQPDRSVVQALLRRGLDVYMVDWGQPKNGDRFLGLEDYIERYLDECIRKLIEISGQRKISLLGYCIGGYLTSIYASLHPENVKNMALMAAPLDFDIGKGLLHLWTREEYFNPELVVEAFGNAPAQFLNGGFVMLDPLGNTLLKYLNLLENIEDRGFVEMFLRMEKWLSDGIPVAGEFYTQFIRDGYQRNLYMKNKLKINGYTARANNLKMPLLAIVAEKDHIVPPESTLNLLKIVKSKDKTTFFFPTGHIGLSVGGESHKKLWPKVAEWFIDRSGSPRLKE